MMKNTLIVVICAVLFVGCCMMHSGTQPNFPVSYRIHNNVLAQSGFQTAITSAAIMLALHRHWSVSTANGL